MAKFDFDIPASFINQLGRLADVDSIAPKMIDEAIPILEDKVIASVAWHRYTGSMERSIKKTKAKAVKGGGYYACVRPTGKDEKGVRNMAKMAYAEYGTSKQAPTPMLTRAIKDSENGVLSKMQEVFNREVGK